MYEVSNLSEDTIDNVFWILVVDIRVLIISIIFSIDPK